MSKERDLVAQNRKARHDYAITDTFEAGIVLLGSEVKSLRLKNANLQDAFVIVDRGEAYMIGSYIAPYSFSRAGGHESDRKRKLLLHRREINKIGAAIAQQGVSVVPLALYFANGKAKVELGLGKGRKAYDKRHALKAKDQKKEMRRATSRSHD